MVSQKAVKKTHDYGESLLMITHGILADFGTFDYLIHEIKVISENDAKREPLKINWEETEVFDNSNRGRLR